MGRAEKLRRGRVQYEKYGRGAPRSKGQGEQAKGQVAFNRAKAAMQAWIRTEAGEESATYRALTKVQRFEERVDEDDREDFSPRQVKTLLQKLPDEVAEIAWFQCVHGMRHGEVFECPWHVRGDYALRIEGSKNPQSRRTVPLMCTPPRRPLAVANKKNYADWVKRAGVKLGWKFTTHTLRACYERWVEDAGIPYRRERRYMGHSLKTMSDRYKRAKISEAEYREDAAKLTAYIKRRLKEEPPSDDWVKVTRYTPKKKTERARDTNVEAVEKKPLANRRRDV